MESQDANLPQIKWTSISLGVLVVLLALVVGAVLLAYHYVSRFRIGGVPSNLSGRVYLSLLPLNAGASSTSGIYEYDLATRAIYKTLVDENSHMTPSYQDGGSQVLFSSRKTGSEYQIRLYDERIELPPFVVTNSTSTDKRFPVWSRDRRAIVFTAHRKGNATSPNEWDVYMMNLVPKREEGGFSEHAPLI